MVNLLPTSLLTLVMQMQSVALPPMQKVGETEMQVMFWRIYKAELYAESLPYQRDRYPQLLSITYLRSIEQGDLLDATQKQWKHLGIAASQQQEWLNKLAELWPNVDKGDKLNLLVDGQQHSHFFSSNDHLGSIDDPAFSEAFLDIWLSENTSHPRLRDQLIGRLR